MSEFSKENLIAADVARVVEGRDVYFGLFDLKKKFPRAFVQVADIRKKEIEGVYIQVVKSENIRVKEHKKVLDIEVQDAELVPCGETEKKPAVKKEKAAKKPKK
jgi:hypothetical protein